MQEVTYKLEKVKNVMAENIDKVLERGTNIELLVSKSNNLAEMARDFNVGSRVLAKKYRNKRVRF